ncbi:heterokaryon incompatibility protein-domain-containing protein [Sordaria brevicollis]|uniref:Heterokaryon incompatibility protein-domain-containing protein n=1 Tax=Sordaria brevicollis TaxID=83679 RepID=A0AAE0U2F6_SORBR|nr:heterokaryon incompatibility protein-domain-containing protein [Sordaria brevicollis]
MSEQLCAVCNRGVTETLLKTEKSRLPLMPSHYSTLDHSILHHSTLDDLVQAANSGCWLCRWITLSRRWSDMVCLNSHGFAFYFKIFAVDDDGALGRLRVEAGCHVVDKDRRWKLYRLIEDLNKTKKKWMPPINTMGGVFHGFLFEFIFQAIHDEKHMTTSSSTASNLPMIRLLDNWLTECRTKHPMCLPPPSAFRPTRLLLIENEHSARVVETKDWVAHHPYVALSHCWGTTSRLQLKKENMGDLLRHIDVAGLPTTYKEGISISLALGFSYIWIDSLCIIQDDAEDWTKEATTMKNVFEHCSVNLSATAAADSSESCFTYRDPVTIQPLDVTINWQEKKPSKSRFRFGVHWVDIRQTDIVSSPLHSRAWVFQEANLSRRRIDLGRSQAWWHCQQNWACEMHPSGVPDDMPNYNIKDKRMYQNMLNRRLVDRSTPSPTSSFQRRSSQTITNVALDSSCLGNDYLQDLQNHWFEPVEIYSDCAITQKTDRLVALAGIAQRYAQTRGLGLEDYLAGVWRQGLLVSLAFSPVHNRKTSTSRPDRYRAPSWSWASLEGKVSYSKSMVSFTPLCKVADVKVIHRFEHYKAGEVKGGVLHLKGRLLELDQQNNHNSPIKVSDDNFDERQAVKYSTIPPLVVSYLEHDPPCKGRRFDQRKEGIVDGTRRTYIQFHDISELSQHGIRLFLLPIIAGKSEWSDFPGFSGLLLCQTLDDYLAGNPIYQRVGCYNRHAGFSEAALKMLPTVPETDVYII